MSKRPILSEYGPDRTTGGNRSTCGGVEAFRPVMKYLPPQGPTELMRSKVGLGGDNCGNAGTQGPASPAPGSSGRPGIGGENCGCCGSQGKY